MKVLLTKLVKVYRRNFAEGYQMFAIVDYHNQQNRYYTAEKNFFNVDILPCMQYFSSYFINYTYIDKCFKHVTDLSDTLLCHAPL
jgi:hypothetical protein